ncbi:MAG TPA: hypothetical protein VMT46_07725 [Anaerolineaceae bacterium]|nr:hypothetical protein [Anaerolineaceae bacterium]
MVFIIILVIVFVALLAVGLYFLIVSPLDTTSKVRDIFIIFMALEFLVVGVALIILMVQLATLINLLQNEIKPILNSTNETVSTLRGTMTFLSDNLTEPVIKLNSYLAGLKGAWDLFRKTRR